MASHTHRYTLGDEEAVELLVDKLLTNGAHQRRREKLLAARNQAVRRYKTSNQKQRQALFHGLLTGYAVAVKLW